MGTGKKIGRTGAGGEGSGGRPRPRGGLPVDSACADGAVSESFLNRVRAQVAPHAYTLAAAGAFLTAAWLCLVNLDYAALWHDEATPAVLGKTLLQQGDIVGWDGRNLTGGTNGRVLNSELRDVWPPLMYVLNAAGFAVFGVNEVGARIVHALMGIAALGVFYLLLRQHLPRHPRLVFFIFAFAAGSVQLLLYFRQSRYFSVMVLTLILTFYLYERYWRSRHRGYLVAFTLVVAAAFFNHYAGGAATMLSLAAWHLLFRARETTWREWGRFAAGGAFVTAAGVGYLAWLGILGGGFLDFAGQTLGPQDVSAFSHFFWRLGAYMRELFTADWISWPVFLWFAGATLLVRAGARGKAKAPARPSGRRERRQPRPPGASAIARTLGDDFPLAATGKVILMGALFALFSAVLSPQPMWANPVADLRYYVGALPLLLAMKGLFVEWLWRRHAVAGAAAFALLLLTSAGAAPFNLRNVFTGQDTLGTHLIQFVREVHRPYRDSISVVSDYLLRNAERDDLVYVPGFADRDALTFYTGHHVRFCCHLDRNTPLPKEKVTALQAPLYVEENTPDWIVGFGGLARGTLERFAARYEVAARLDVHPYPTQRPELNFHAFTPLDAGNRGVLVLRRLDGEP